MEAAKASLKDQLAAYLAEQPESTRRIHRWMGGLTVASLAVPAGLFAWALYLSINWQNVEPAQIPFGWLILMAGATVPIVLFGLHAVVIRAFPAAPIEGMASQLATGSKAVATGVGLMGMAVVIAAFWGLFAYAVATQNLALVERLGIVMGVVIGVGATIAIVQSLFRQLARSL
jgi:hypothetical protein